MRVYGGAELVIVKILNYLSKKNIQNSLLTTCISPEIREKLQKTELIIIKSEKNLLSKIVPSNKLKEAFELHKKLKKLSRDFDVINVHNYPANISAFGCSKPVVWMCNEPELYLSFKSTPSSNIPKKLYYASMLRFEKFIVRHYIKKAIVADEFNANRFKKIYGVEPEIINYGIDYEFFSMGNKMRALDRYSLHDSFVILHVGWIQPFKNQLESVKVLEKLKSHIPNVKLVLAGFWDTVYKEKIEKLIKERELEKNVIFTGHIPREDLRDLYHACDVLIHPVKPQGGWLAPFEVLCAKKPILVSPELTTSEIIKKQGIGIVTEDYARIIVDIYKNPEKYNEMAERGFRWVKENLSWDKFCEKMLEAFYECLGGD
ncbi:MAG: glycosyltransferase family 4 protein [Archaeoglobaceae archaeon]